MSRAVNYKQDKSHFTLFLQANKNVAFIVNGVYLCDVNIENVSVVQHLVKKYLEDFKLK